MGILDSYVDSRIPSAPYKVLISNNINKYYFLLKGENIKIVKQREKNNR